MASVVVAALVVGTAGLAGTAAAATPAPRVTQMSPSSGTSGTLVTITGTNLTGATAVTFGPGNNATTFSVTNATTISATAPAGSGTVDVQVTTPGGTSQVQTLDWFTYTASLTLNPTQVIVPADGTIEGAVTATLTSGASPAASGITVTATETTPSLGTKSLASCSTGTVGAGQCLIETEPDATAETGTVTVTASGFATGMTTVLYSAPGSAPTGLTMALANGNGSSAAPSGADTFSDANHYFVDETSGVPGQYENTASQAVVSATMVNGSTPLSTGTEPYALDWTLHNTGANSLYIDAIANTSEMPYTNVICTLATQTDPNGSLACTPSSYDLDYNPHFSNPANPGAIGLGVTNNTMTASTTSGVRVVAAGATITFTTYMVGQANNAMVALDSPTGLPTSATISAQLAKDPAFTAIAGTAFGNTVTSNLKWLAPATGTSVSGAILATDPAATTTAGSNHDWVVLNVGGSTPTLVNFGQSSGQTFTDNGTSVSENSFESDLASATTATLAVTNYGSSGQVNAFTTVPSVTAVSPSSGSTGGGTSVVITGTNLTGATGVKFGSTSAVAVTVNSPTQITATAPAKAAGRVDVTVTTSQGTSTVSAPADQFTFIAPAVPSVTGVSPTSGSTTGGTPVTITGTNFTGATGVAFGSTPAAYTVNGPAQITATAPAGAAGRVDVTVTTTLGTSSTSAADAFTYVQPPPAPTPTASASGYDLVGADGGVFVFPPGQAGGYYGSLPGLGVRVNDIAGMVPSPDDRGYFLVGSDGGVFAFGDAPYLGSLPGLGVRVHDIKGIVPTRDDRGYFLVGSDGGVFAFGDAPFLGSLPSEGIHLTDVIGIAATPTDDGYWVVTASGSVFPFGDAGALGGLGATPSPVAGISATPDGGGYWIVTQNGGVFTFGDAGAYGSLPGIGVAPSRPVISLVPTADDRGYWLIGSDGGIFTFGDAPFVGSLPGLGLRVTDIVGAVPTKV